MATDAPFALSGRMGVRNVRLVGWVLPFLTILAAGCLTTKDEVGSGDKPPPQGVVCQIAATWQNSIAYAADPTHGGAMNPGLAGRLYLFGETFGKPVTGDGSLLVEMFDETQGTPVKREQWEIDPKTLQRLLRCDMIGWGYTLFLPSHEYKSNMTSLRLRTCYRPAKGSPLYTELPVTMAEGNGVVRGEARTLTAPTPVAPPTPVAAFAGPVKR